MDYPSLVQPRFADERKTIGRSEFERDQDRILFSSAFRRLNDKTQVFPIPEHYFVHNRMTHSLETASVGRSLGSIVGERFLSAVPGWGEMESRNLGDLVRAACLAHDIGNPPFGHSGEDAISSFFLERPEVLDGLSEEEKAEFFAFEGNAQGLRVIGTISSDLRLTSNTVAAFIKYPRRAAVSAWTDPSSAARRDQRKYGCFKTESALAGRILGEFGCAPLAADGSAYARFPFAYLAEAADDICYLIIDLEDAVRLGIVRLTEVEELLSQLIRLNPEGSVLDSRKPGADDNERMGYLRARTINSLVFQCAEAFSRVSDLVLKGRYGGSLIDEIPGSALLGSIRRLSVERIYRDRPVLEIEAAGFEVLAGLLDIITAVSLEDSGAIRPPSRAKKDTILGIMPAMAPRPDEGRYARLRRIVDYVSGMTDSYALSLYRKLKGFELPRMY